MERRGWAKKMLWREGVSKFEAPGQGIYMRGREDEDEVIPQLMRYEKHERLFLQLTHRFEEQCYEKHIPKLCAP